MHHQKFLPHCFTLLLLSTYPYDFQIQSTARHFHPVLHFDAVFSRLRRSFSVRNWSGENLHFGIPLFDGQFGRKCIATPPGAEDSYPATLAAQESQIISK